MKAFRTVLFWCHLSAGVVAGIVVFVMSVTGVLLTYQKQITLWADTRDARVESAAQTDVDQLLERIKQNSGRMPASLTLRSDPQLPASAGFPNEKGPGEQNVYVHPATGETLGSGSKAVQSFFRSVTDWHRWMAMSGTSRGTGRSITGISNLLFLFIVLSGLYIWFPRVLNSAQFRNILWFRGGLSPKARDFNWHNVIGIWCLVPLALIVASGVVISYPWASNLVFRLAGEQPPSPQGPPGGGARPPEGGREGRPRDTVLQPVAETAPARLSSIVSAAQNHQPDWKTLNIRLPKASDSTVTVSVDSGMGGEPQKRVTLVFDRETAAVKKAESFADGSPGRRARTFLRFAHTGEFAGFAGQTIAGLASLGACFLVYTGIALSWRRFRNWRATRARKTQLAAAL